MNILRLPYLSALLFVLIFSCHGEESLPDRIRALDRLDATNRHEAWKSLLEVAPEKITAACNRIHENPGSAWSYRVLMHYVQWSSNNKASFEKFVNYARDIPDPLISLTVEAVVDTERYQQTIKSFPISLSKILFDESGQPQSPTISLAIALHLLRESEVAHGDLLRRYCLGSTLYTIPYAKNHERTGRVEMGWRDVPDDEYQRVNAIRQACLQTSDDLAVVIPFALVADDEHAQSALKRLMKKTGFDGVLCGLVAYTRLSRPNLNGTSLSSFHGEAYDEWLATLTDEQVLLLGRFFQLGFKTYVPTSNREAYFKAADQFYLNFHAIGPFLASKEKIVPAELRDYYQRLFQDSPSEAIGHLQRAADNEITSSSFPWESAPFFSRTDLDRELATLKTVHPSAIPVIEWMKSVALTAGKYPTGAHLSKAYASMPAILLPEEK